MQIHRIAVIELVQEDAEGQQGPGATATRHRCSRSKPRRPRPTQTRSASAMLADGLQQQPAARSARDEDAHGTLQAGWHLRQRQRGRPGYPQRVLVRTVSGSGQQSQVPNHPYELGVVQPSRRDRSPIRSALRGRAGVRSSERQRL
jgi:hypothetical protein